ncbi:MAG: ABC transporter ATP-binding protein, partial [Clostridia bacterium]|nr:ABC transporter ATP-binding protein [Clostridia bacterium]
MEKRKDQSVGKAWLKKEMRPYRGNIVFLAVLTVISAVLALSFSYLIKDLVNGAAAGNKRRILTFAGILLCIVFTKVVVQTLSSYLAEKYRAKITVGLRGRIFEKILRSDFSKVEKYHSGDLLTRMTSDVQEVAADSVSILPAVAGMIAQCIGAVSALLLLDPLFTAVFTFGGVVVGVVSAVFRKKVKKYHKEQTEADGASRAFMQEGIASLMTLKAYGAEEKSAEKCRSILNDYYGKRMKKNRFRVGMGAAFSFLSNAGTVFAVLWCSFRILRGDGADFGSVLSVVMLLGQLQQPFASFSAVLPVLYARAASGERLAETDALETEVKTEKGKGDGSVLKIQADGLCFTYGRNPVFENAAMQIEQGKIVCITGESGSGKSTLFKLLLSVYTPSAGGAYYIDGQGNKTLLSASTRELFAYVPQGNF